MWHYWWRKTNANESYDMYGGGTTQVDKGRVFMVSYIPSIRRCNTLNTSISHFFIFWPPVALRGHGGPTRLRRVLRATCLPLVLRSAQQMLKPKLMPCSIHRQDGRRRGPRANTVLWHIPNTVTVRQSRSTLIYTGGKFIRQLAFFFSLLVFVYRTYIRMIFLIYLSLPK